MIKRFFLLLCVFALAANTDAQSARRNTRTAKNRNFAACVKPQAAPHRADTHDVLLLAENFDKFSAGSETEPDQTDLCVEELGWCISPDYLQTPGWNGGGIYQAGGCAMIYTYLNDFDNEYHLGYLESPRFDTTASRGEFVVCFRARSILDEDWLGVCGVPTNQKEAKQKFAIIGKEWGYYEVTLQCGDDNTCVQFSPSTDGCFIDDIRIIQTIDDNPDVPEYALATPTNLSTDNYSEEGYTAHWAAVDGAEDYALYDHIYYTTRANEEPFDYINTDFSRITVGTVEEPLAPSSEEAGMGTDSDFALYLDDIVGRADWMIYMPMLAGGTLAVDNSYSAIMPAGIESPALRLAAPGEDLHFAFDVMSPDLTTLTLYAYGPTAMVGSIEIPITPEWKEHHVTIPACPDATTFELVVEDTDPGYVFFDNLHVWQNLPAGTTASVPTGYYETANTYARILTPETPAGYRHAFTVSAYKYERDSEGDIIDYDMSAWSAPCFADGGTAEGIVRVHTPHSPATPYSLTGRRATKHDRIVIEEGRAKVK